MYITIGTTASEMRWLGRKVRLFVNVHFASANASLVSTHYRRQQTDR